MFSNSEEMIHSIREEFEGILNFIVDSPSEETADMVEKNLFYQLMSLGAALLQLLFCLHDEKLALQRFIDRDGVRYSSYGQRQRSYFCIFGKVTFSRCYFYNLGAGGICPLDEQLSLPQKCYSYWLIEIVEDFCVQMSYNKVVQLISRVFHINLNTRFLQEVIMTDGQQASAFYEAKPPPEAETEAEILVISADGKGIPLTQTPSSEGKVRLGKGEKPTKKKEAVVTTVYTAAPRERTPTDVVSSLFKTEVNEKTDDSKAEKLHNKHLGATLEGKSAAFDSLANEVSGRDTEHINDRVAITDGCPSLQNQMTERFGNFCLILDIIHVVEYLWKAANAWLGETHRDRINTVAKWTETLLCGNCDQVIGEIDQIILNSDLPESGRTTLEKVKGYLLRNRQFMKYDQYLASGWPIASGVIEGACRHLVKDRFELSGMRWTQPGAEALLQLRCVAENDDWQDFHRFVRQKHHHDLYNSSPPHEQLVEEQCLAYAA